MCHGVVKRNNALRLGIEGYLVLKKVVPSLAAECVADKELEEVQWDVSDDAVQPYDSCPAPPNSLDLCESPFRINGKQSCNLPKGNRFEIY